MPISTSTSVLVFRTATFLGLALSILVSKPSYAQDACYREFLADLRIEKNVTYKTVKGKKLDLWLFLPKTRPSEPMPVMLYTHGGGWGGGNKFNILKPAFRGTLKWLLDAGVACASVEYRRARKGGSTTIDSVADCKDAAKFLVANAQRLKLDAQRIGVWGGSAGGHLALMTGLAPHSEFDGDDALAAHDPTFCCIVSYFPATTFLRPEFFEGTSFESPERIEPIIGGQALEHPDRVALLSPTEHLRADSPPILLLHGDNDKVLPFAFSEYLMAEAQKRGADVELLTVKGGGHSFKGKPVPGIDKINEYAAAYILEQFGIKGPNASWAGTLNAVTE